MTDTDNIGQGFRTSRRWSLAFCDRAKEQNGDPAPPGGDLGKNDLELTPPDAYYASPNKIEDLPVLYINRVETCSTGNCAYQLTTRLIVNLDKDGNGQIDPQYLVNGQQATICFYAEAQRPTIANWRGNLQARIAAGGGDKTVNFKMTATATAVTLSSFGAHADTAPEPWLVIPLLALASIGALATFVRKRGAR